MPAQNFKKMKNILLILTITLIATANLSGQNYTGQNLKCGFEENAYDYEYDNYLRINFRGTGDLVLKLMKINTYGDDQCVRMVYLKGNTTYSIENIPQGKYYVKLAYGKEWTSSGTGSSCKGGFAKDGFYEKGEDVFDYNVVENYSGYSIPSYELSLHVISTYSQNNFNTDEINKDAFND